MARIAGIDLPKNKRGVIGLTYIYGIGHTTAQKVLDMANVPYSKRIQEWTDDEANEVRRVISDNFKVEGQLRGETQMNIKRLIDIGCYRGQRHKYGLPLRGQRTQKNARTRKGKKKTVAGKKKAIK
jgi:small subunit ribosomal protein S13